MSQLYLRMLIILIKISTYVFSRFPNILYRDKPIFIIFLFFLKHFIYSNGKTPYKTKYKYKIISKLKNLKL